MAKNATFNSELNTDDEKKARKLVLKYTSPDSVLYGMTTLFDDLAALHSAGVVHSNITPANIAVTKHGEWRLCGFGFSENSVFQFEFANDYAPFFRPSAAFMTPKQASGKYSNAQTDCAQVFNSIFAVFGNKNPIFDYSKEFKPGKLPNGEQAVSQVAEKMFGICQSGAKYSITPQAAIQNANLN